MTVYSTKATRTRSRINLSASTRRPQLFGFARRRLAAPVRDRAGPRTVSAIVSSAKRFWILREKRPYRSGAAATTATEAGRAWAPGPLWRAMHSACTRRPGHARRASVRLAKMSQADGDC